MAASPPSARQPDSIEGMGARLRDLKQLLVQLQKDVVFASGVEHSKLEANIEKTKGDIRSLEAEIDAAQAEAERSQQNRLATCPYRGLHYFDVEHAPNYFGREAMVQKVLAKLRETNFVAVVGPSGCGKSSLVRAGMVPALRNGDLPGSREWQVEFFRPGSQPLNALAVPLAAWLEPGLDRIDLLASARKLAGHLAAGALDLPFVVSQFPQPTPRYLLVADQFEETFTLSEDAGQQHMLIDSLLALAAQPRVAVIVILRADFTGHLLAEQRLGEQADRGWVNVLAMTEAELRQAIERPAEQSGVRYEDRLVQRILADVAAAPGQLPLLEFALTELWAQPRGDGLLTHAGYDAIGGVSRALAMHAEESFAALSAGEQAQAPDLFSNLVRVARPDEDGGEDTRRRVHLHDLPAGLHELARRLAGSDARLLVMGHDPATRQATIEVVHEALIRQWGRLRAWLDADRSYLLWRQRYRADLDRWQADEDTGALLRGGPLAEAERWRGQHPQGWSDADLAYLEACRMLRDNEMGVEQERQKERFRLIMQAVVIALVLAVLAGVLGFQSRLNANLARAREQVALARQLAAQAQLLMERSAGQDGTLPVLLSTESLLRSATLEGNIAAAESFGQLPKPLGQMVHDGPVYAVAFSPDGHLVVSGSGDKTARVWEAMSGHEISRMTHSDAVSAVAFSSDGRWIVSGGDAAGIGPEKRYGDDRSARVWEAATGREIARMTHNGAVTDVTFSPKGNWVVSASWDKTARVWEAATGREIARMTHTDMVTSAAFSPDSQLVISGSSDGTALVWEASTGREIARMTHDTNVLEVAISPDGTMAVSVSGGSSGNARVWEISTGREIFRKEHGGQWGLSALAFSPDSRALVTGGADGTVHVWGTTGREWNQIKGSGPIDSIAFSADGRYLLIGEGDGARVWDVVADAQLVRSFHDGMVSSVAFSPSGHQVVTGSSAYATSVGGNVARVWEVTTGNEVARTTFDRPAYGGAVSDVAFSADGRWVVVAGGGDRTARVWEAKTGLEVSRMMHNGIVMTAALSPDARRVVSGGEDNIARLWEVTTGREISRVTHDATVNDVAYSPDGTWVVSGSADNTVRVWDAVTGNAIALMIHDRAVTNVEFSPDGRWVVSGSADNTVRVWEAATGKAIARMTHDHVVSDVAFSPDSRWVASASMDRTSRVWDAASGREMVRMEHNEGVSSVNFSSNGLWVVSGSYDHTVRIWEIASGHEISRMTHDGGVTTVGFSPDGGWVVSGGYDGSVSLWEAASGQEVARMRHDYGGVHSVQFSPDGHWVASGGSDYTARVWRWQPNDLITEACSRIERNLTQVEWDQYLINQPYRQTCPELPAGD